MAQHGILLLERGRKYLDGGPFARGVLLLSGGAVLGQGLTIIAAPLISRLYSPAEFGIFSVYLSILGFVTIIASWRYEQAITLPREVESAANVVAVAAAILAIQCVAVAIVAFAAGPALATWLKVPALAANLWLLPFGLAAAGLYQILNYWAIREQAYGLSARTKLSQSIVGIGLQVGWGFTLGGPFGLLLGDLAGRMAGNGSIIGFMRAESGPAFRAVSRAGMAEAARRYIRFPAMSGPSALLSGIGALVPVLTLTAAFGPVVVGTYAMALRMVGAPLALVGQSIGQVFVATGSLRAHDDPFAVERLFMSVLRRLAILGVGLVAIAALLAPPLFALAFDASWSEMGRYIQVLSPYFLLHFIASPLSGAYDICERQDVVFAAECARLALLLAVPVTVAVLRPSTLVTLGLLSAAGALGYGIYLAGAIYCVRAARERAPARP